ncbi:hypothetical protein J2P12_03075 [Candidatus Bathyarchaeota archaeon]|nr:hypothetical protein [Candidatus Bathyarchaeota archaeon]
MRVRTLRVVGNLLGIYIAFSIYFGAVAAITWYGVPARFNLSSQGFPYILLSAGIVGLSGFSYLTLQWRKQTRRISTPKTGTLSSTKLTREERFRGLAKVGSFLTGVLLLVFGLAEFSYGLLLLGEKYQGYQSAAYAGRPYDGPYVAFLAYAPEVIVLSAICVFILGIWMLVYSQSDTRPKVNIDSKRTNLPRGRVWGGEDAE